MALSAWGADTGAPSQFAGLFTCDWPARASLDTATAASKRASTRRSRHAGPEAGARWKEAYTYLADAAPVVPLVNHRNVVLVSDRVGNYQHHPFVVSLLDRLLGAIAVQIWRSVRPRCRCWLTA